MNYTDIKNQTGADKNNTPVKTPLNILKERMYAPESQQNIQSGGFSVNVDDFDEKESTHIRTKDYPCADKGAVPINATQQISLKPKSRQKAEDKAAEIDEAPAEPVIQKKEEEAFDEADNTLLKKMHRYTVDENGNDAAKKEEPAYRLQTVTEILKSGDPKAIAELSKADTPDLPEPITTEDKTQVVDVKSAPEQKVGYISDIDEEPDTYIPDKPMNSNTATIRFTPVKNGKVTVSSMTKSMDIVESVSDRIDKNISKDFFGDREFDEFSPYREANEKESLKDLLLHLAKKKRSAFISLVITLLSALVLIVFSLFPTKNMLAATIIFAVAFIANADVFASFKTLFTKLCSSDIIIAFSGLTTLALSVLGYIRDERDTFYIVLLGIILLFFRSLAAFFDSSSILGNLIAVSSKKRTKNALCLIGDTPTTLAMAKNSIEGDVLIAGAKPISSPEDFMKYSKYVIKFSGKLTHITLISIGVALVFGIVSAVLGHNAVSGVYAAAVVLSLACVPTLFFIDTLPLHSASKKLNQSGAMITGSAAAQKLEQANAVVVSTADIFPAGSISLEDMKVLCNNNVDDILLRAAALTEAMESPLCPIFKKIVGSSTDYEIPDSDTVKYEERLGISGWVKDELMFIGNRTLLESHGISVPDVDLDHKILERGYFPIYVAKENKACVLIVAKYKTAPSVAKKLQQITSLGITLLIQNSDPNIGKDLICDYFDLYDDSVMVMSSAGVKMYKSATDFSESAPCPAAYKGSGMCLVDIMNSASKIKKSNILLTTLYSLASVLGTVYYLYTSLTGGGIDTGGGKTVLLYVLAATLVSLIAYFFKKP